MIPLNLQVLRGATSPCKCSNPEKPLLLGASHSSGNPEFLEVAGTSQGGKTKANPVQCPDDTIQHRKGMDFLVDKVDITGRASFRSCALVSRQLHLISNPKESGDISNQKELQESYQLMQLHLEFTAVLGKSTNSGKLCS